MPVTDPSPDPHGVLQWVNAVAETLKQAYAALIIPTAAGIAWLVRTRGTNRDKDWERAEARRKSEEDAHQRIADQLDQDSSERFAEMKVERAADRRALAEKDIEINRQRGLVRQWFDHAHNMRSFAINKRPGAMPPDLPYDPETP